MLVVQSSVYQTIRASILRVAAVTSGVLVAVLAASTIGFSWWTLGLAILAALTIGHVLRLGEHVLEAPISAMLIFALGAASEAGAEDRVLETLIGAATGLAATLLVPTVRVRPPRRPSRTWPRSCGSCSPASRTGCAASGPRARRPAGRRRPSGWRARSAGPTGTSGPPRRASGSTPGPGRGGSSTPGWRCATRWRRWSTSPCRCAGSPGPSPTTSGSATGAGC
ncbi:FUSC family protein [Actinomadura madurae]|uniref:FUSC family protein n=1 Tax=Actinomadura madurae TaxID=1993 RepID=UPI00355828AE